MNGTYVDKNIKIEVNTPDGSLEVKKAGALSASVSVDANVYTSDTETKYPLTVKGDAAISDVLRFMQEKLYNLTI